MAESPLRRTKAELQAARRALTSMGEAQDRANYVEAWQTFLDKIEKVWKKAAQECRGCDGFEQWVGKYRKLRRNDQLLQYLLQARNADQHSIQPVMGLSKEVTAKGVPPGGTVEITADRSGRVHVGGEFADVHEEPVRFGLAPVRNRSGVYPPPRHYLGEPVTDRDPLTVGRLGLDFYACLVVDAEERFFSGDP